MRLRCAPSSWPRGDGADVLSCRREGGYTSNVARMRDFFQHRSGHFLLLTATAFLMFFANLGGASLWDLDEGRNSTCAREMMLSGDWVVPTFNGELRDHKPALLYWLQIFSY